SRQQHNRAAAKQDVQEQLKRKIGLAQRARHLKRTDDLATKQQRLQELARAHLAVVDGVDRLLTRERLIEQILIHTNGVLNIRRFSHQSAVGLIDLDLEIGGVEAADCLRGQNKDRILAKIVSDALIVRRA